MFACVCVCMCMHLLVCVCVCACVCICSHVHYLFLVMPAIVGITGNHDPPQVIRSYDIPSSPYLLGKQYWRRGNETWGRGVWGVGEGK